MSVQLEEDEGKRLLIRMIDYNYRDPLMLLATNTIFKFKSQK